MPRGEMMVLQQLFSAGADTAPIRKQALDFGLGLLAADQLEQANITTARELTDANIRSFQSKLKVRRESGILTALPASTVSSLHTHLLGPRPLSVAWANADISIDTVVGDSSVYVGFGTCILSCTLSAGTGDDTGRNQCRAPLHARQQVRNLHTAA